MDRDTVLRGGPYFAYGRPLITKAMPRCFEIDSANDLNMVPVWIRLPGLPLDLWNERILSQIVSRVGNPIATDSFTKTKERFTYARVLVEVDASKDLVKSIPLRLLNGKVRLQYVDYEFLPKFCDKCRQFGHASDGCAAHNDMIKAQAAVVAPPKPWPAASGANMLTRPKDIDWPNMTEHIRTAEDVLKDTSVGPAAHGVERKTWRKSIEWFKPSENFRMDAAGSRHGNDGNDETLTVEEPKEERLASKVGTKEDTNALKEELTAGPNRMGLIGAKDIDTDIDASSKDDTDIDASPYRKKKKKHRRSTKKKRHRHYPKCQSKFMR